MKYKFVLAVCLCLLSVGDGCNSKERREKEAREAALAATKVDANPAGEPAADGQQKPDAGGEIGVEPVEEPVEIGQQEPGAGGEVDAKPTEKPADDGPQGPGAGGEVGAEPVEEPPDYKEETPSPPTTKPRRKTKSRRPKSTTKRPKSTTKRPKSTTTKRKKSTTRWRQKNEQRDPPAGGIGNIGKVENINNDWTILQLDMDDTEHLIKDYKKFRQKSLNKELVPESRLCLLNPYNTYCIGKLMKSKKEYMKKAGLKK